MKTLNSFDLERFLPYRLNRAAESVSRAFQSSYRKRYGLTRPEWRTLAALGSRGSITATEIAAHSFMHRTKVSRAVQALERRRWLVRRRDEADRRVEHLTLTAHGQRAYADIVQLAVDYQKELEAGLGAEATQALKKGLNAIEANLPGARPERRSRETMSGASC